MSEALLTYPARGAFGLFSRRSKLVTSRLCESAKVKTVCVQHHSIRINIFARSLFFDDHGGIPVELVSNSFLKDSRCINGLGGDILKCFPVLVSGYLTVQFPWAYSYNISYANCRKLALLCCAFRRYMAHVRAEEDL